MGQETSHSQPYVPTPLVAISCLSKALCVCVCVCVCVCGRGEDEEGVGVERCRGLTSWQMGLKFVLSGLMSHSSARKK